MTKVYISGETSPAHLKALKKKLSLIREVEIIVPQDHMPTLRDWEENMAMRKVLLKKCAIIYMLSNWSNSLIARWELHTAMARKKVLAFEDMDDLKLLFN